MLYRDQCAAVPRSTGASTSLKAEADERVVRPAWLSHYTIVAAEEESKAPDARTSFMWTSWTLASQGA